MPLRGDLRCPSCGATASTVHDTRGVVDGRKVRRCRRCLQCGAKGRTAERWDDPALLTEAEAQAILEDATRLLTLVKAKAKAA